MASSNGEQNLLTNFQRQLYYYILLPLVLQSYYNLQQIAAMQRHFNFGHTIVPEENNEESSQNLLELFKIGDQQIKIPNKADRLSSENQEDSDETVKHKKIKKEKKQKKEKKEKKQEKKEKEGKEHKHKQKKDKKSKKQKHSQQSHDSEINQQIVPYDKAKKIQLYEKYSKVLQNKTLEQKFAQRFELNVKIGEGMLNVDIIRFPENRLYQYGPMDKQIPRYQRLPDFQMIIGFKKSKHKKARKLIRELNKIINQKNTSPHEDEISINRYFHFQGYEHTGLEKLAVEQKILTNECMVKFNLQQTASASEEETVMKITKEFNKKINQNPKNIELWMEFINIQDKFSLSIGSLKNKSAVLDRKISILEKALNLNPFNERLGISYLGFLFQKQFDHKQIGKKCLEFIRENPSSIALWKFYFNLSIEQFSTFSHAYIRKIFQEMNELFKKAIEKTKSAIEIWKIRKASLQIMKSMLQIYKLQGYGELATGIIVALIQYNIFMPDEAVKSNRPEDKLHLFQQYWEDCEVYKLAETNLGNSWSNIVKCSEEENHSFIGSYQCKDQQKEKLASLREIRESERVWRMSNAIRDQKIIESMPESFILYEDIDFTLMLYRDNESVMTLIDSLADHLELPLVFSSTNIHNQFNFKLIEKIFKKSFKDDSYSFQFLTFRRCCYFWTQFWNPAFTWQLLPQQSIIKMQYFRRVLTSAKQKLPNHKTVINQYLSFIACVIYLSPQVQNILQISEQQSLKLLSDILEEDPLNLATWCMYIEATYSMKHNQQQCIDCFLQLFQTAKLMVPARQDLVQVHLEILFWLTEFCQNHHIPKGRALLQILKTILFDDNRDEPFSITSQVNSFDCLQLEQYFRTQASKLFQNQSQKTSKQSVIAKYKGMIFILYYLSEFPASSLNDLLQKIVLFLIGELDAAGNSKNNLFILKLLISYQQLKHECISKYQLLKLFPYLNLIQYWATSSKKPFLICLTEFQCLDHRSLSLWMANYIFLLRSRPHHDHLYEYFYIIAKKICLEDRLSDQRPQYITLLNELLIFDVNENHSKFIMYSLHHVPFSKTLYMLNLLLASNEAERQKLSAIIQDKSIRVLDQSILL